ncbi:cytochrome c oxidase accessory protein CcoG [Maricaulis virginensis]|uniref:Ferredoxin n=1 Tax=Maricaulis virginensis TaxID=144022 RepID=A0A9W6IQE6_9PROT|nr:cytochrome c oxidase accessory protein CcoG [Maricaulis virginensis]GLK53439.1 ferredoxin [Maricaulis virginensis]
MSDKNTRAMAAPGIRKSKAEAVNAADTRELYKKREPIYPKLAHGKFRTVKWVVMAVTLGIYYLVPFLRWDRGPDAPDQAVLVDFAGRRFYFFFIEIWPQEVYYITGLLILAALALFLATALFGRVWCGYACPQTVWTDLFIWVERAFEGDRNARIKLDRSPWSFDKAWRKIGKHAVWLVIALATGGAWILYFHDAYDVIGNFFTGQAEPSSYLFAGILTFTTYTLAGTMREQVCTYMCPWPRIQAAMTDRDALNVTYRVDRGEPRGPHKKNESWDGRGDCIDCKQCVAVCPMGIDIRDGAQLECIQCALCIDACDDIMRKVDRPTGLITYETDDNVDRFQRGEKAVYKFIRPRTVVYGVAFAIVAAIMLAALLNRSELELNSQRDRNPNFVILSDGSVRNGYNLKVVNKANEPRILTLSIEGDPQIETRLLGAADDAPMQLTVDADRTQDFVIYLTLPASAIDGARETFNFRVTDTRTGETATTPSMIVTGAE